MAQHIEDLAAFVAGLRWRDIPAAVQARAKLALLDTVGVILAGSLRPEVAAFRAGLTGGTGATLLAPGLPRTDPHSAALLNALAGRAVELCDGLHGVQPSVQLVPGLLALAEPQDSSGEEVLTAFVAGYEVAGRLAAGFVPHRYAHPNGQIAMLACAAAGGRLRGLDAAGISLAMRIVTTMLMTPSYTNTVAGATALNLPAGLSATASVLAPALALAGYAAQPDAVEDALGTMVGRRFDAAQVTDGLGLDWQISGSYFRFYACCNPIHAALDCLQDILAELRPDVAAIERIDVATYAFASVMRNTEPPNYFASKYSLPHAAATLIVRGGLGFAELDDSALDDPAIAALRRRVQVSEDPALSARVPAARPARVTVVLTDGRQATVERPMSRRDQDQPDPAPEVRAKFRQLAGTVLPPDSVRASEQAIDRADHWRSAGELMAALSASGTAFKTP